MMTEERTKCHEESFKGIIERMQSQDEELVELAIQKARQMLENENIINGSETFVKLGILPILDGILDSDNWALQYEAIGLLGKLGDKQQFAGFRNVTIRKLVELLRSESEIIATATACLLSSISIEKVLRDEVLKCDVVEILLDIHYFQLIPPRFLESIACLMMSLCIHTGNGDPYLNELLKLLPAIAKLLNHQDQTSLFLATAAIRNITKNLDGITAVINAGCVPALIRLLGFTDSEVLGLSLESVQNVLSASDSQIDIAINEGVLIHIRKLLIGSNNDFIELVGSLAALIKKSENPGHMQAVLESGLSKDI